MGLNATLLTAPKEVFLPQAQGKGGLLGRLIVKEPLFELCLEYKSYYKVKMQFHLTARKFIFGKKKIDSKLVMVVDAMTGSCAVAQQDIELSNVDGKLFFDGEVAVTETEAVELAKRYATRVLFGLYRGFATFHAVETEIFYRPHWIAYYGDPAKSSKARFLPFEADGLTFGR